MGDDSDKRPDVSRILEAAKEQPIQLQPSDANKIIYQIIRPIVNVFIIGGYVEVQKMITAGTYVEGDMTVYGSVINNITTLSKGDDDQKKIAEALAAIFNATKSEGVPEATKKTVAEYIKCLSEEAGKPPEKRNRSVLSSILSSLREAAGAAGAVADAVKNWLPLLVALFGA